MLKKRAKCLSTYGAQECSKKTTSAKRDVNNKLCVFIKGIKPPHRQISVMPISAHSLRMSSGQMLA